MSQMLTTDQTEQRWQAAGDIAGVIFPLASTERKVAGSVPVLASVEALTESWLSEALRLSFPECPPVIQFTCEPVATNDFESLVRLQLDYGEGVKTGSGAWPSRVLAKVSRPLPAPQWAQFVGRSFEREASAYQELNNHYACRIPGLLFASGNLQCFNMLLEDCGGEVYLNDDSPDDHQPEHEAVLEELAQLHGCFVRTSPASAPRWQLRQRDNARFIAHCYRRGLDALRGVYAGWLAQGHFCLVEKFADYVADWHRYERHLLTLTHGDVRFENVILQREESNCRANLLGWRLAGVRNPMYDVASLLSNELSYVARNNSESALLQRYCRVFEQSGIQYPLREASEDYRFNLFAPLIFNICVCGFLRDSLKSNGKLIKRIRRNCMAIFDWNAMDLMEKRRNVIA